MKFQLLHVIPLLLAVASAAWNDNEAEVNQVVAKVSEPRNWLSADILI
jgi:hypothetical protein